MYREISIREQVEARLDRRLLFAADAGAWLFYLWVFKYTSFAHFEGMAVFLALIWMGVLGLHFLWTFYAELRDWLVQRAVERERRYAFAQDAIYEKPKRARRFELIDDAEFPESADSRQIERR